MFNRYSLVICYVAIENGHRNHGFTHEKWVDFPVRYVNVRLPVG